jgi:hypothetical protein
LPFFSLKYLFPGLWPEAEGVMAYKHQQFLQDDFAGVTAIQWAPSLLRGCMPLGILLILGFIGNVRSLYF